MESVIIKLTSQNTVTDKGVKPYNLMITVDLMEIWGAIEEEVSRYKGDVYLYIQVQFIIPIIDPLGNQVEAMGGISQIFPVKTISSDKKLMLYASYDGTYDAYSVEKESAEATIWVYQQLPNNS